ncbi:glycoside hydrolase family 26 protein [Nitratireductor luteus]|uniref:glycoside hydrolase family 26 protein n=1 Tax=Nitratireductor luteus TaxID=2976980 RepID=UPI002240A3EA|nr:glycoside hydrolase family 26 protein [Nitratireductor luteus]
MNRTLKTAALSAAAIVASGVVFAANSPRGIPDPNSTTAGTPSDKRPVVTPSSISFGAYDPHGDFGEDPNSTIEHLFLPWEDVDLSTLAIADEYALARGRSLLISVEPWSWDRDWRVSSGELYSGIVSGRYDANAAAVCSQVAGLQSPVTVRFAQEMDERDNQFTWAQWSGPEYIRAYRRFVTECRKHLPNVEFMWSPKGNADLQDYYPGDDVVDVIGLSVFGYQPYDQEQTGRDQTFAERLAPGYNLVKGYGKAIVVAELGYEGDQAYVRRWAEAVTKRHAEFPELTAVVYFNDREVYPWPDNFGLPNWRVVEESTN